MRCVAAYCLAVLGGNEAPKAKDIKSILSSVGIDAADDQIQKVIGELGGKDLAEIIAIGKEKLASMPVGGAVAAGGGGAADAPAAAEEKKEEKKKEESEEESDDDMGFGLSTKEGHPHFCWIATALMFPLRKTNTTEVLLTSKKKKKKKKKKVPALIPLL